MLSIRRNQYSAWRMWIGAWFQILDNLFNVSTLGFWNLNTTACWFFNCDWKPAYRSYATVDAWVIWQSIYWTAILKASCQILTFNYIYFED